MAKHFARFMLLAAVCLVGAGVLQAQVLTSGTLVGTVSDPTGAVIAGADLKIRDEATGVTIETKSGPDGTFVVANLKPGSYTVTVVLQGFKTAEYRAVKIVVGGTYDLQAKLEVGQVESTVVVEAGAEVLETQSTTISTTITGKSLTQLPFTSRDALDLAILMPGAMTTGRPRATSFMGLPKGAINITIDGINAQDNVLKSSDGFFTIIRARVDAIEEFSISTAAQGSEQAAEGAVQIRFETKRGTNDYHGGVWYQHRNDFLNSNFYFNTITFVGGVQRPTDRQRQRLHQFGYKIGGPIWKEKLFFFTDFDFYRNPESRTRTRTILTDQATLGQFTYSVGAVPATLPAWVTCNATALTCTSDLLAMAANFGFTSAIDATIGGYLTAMNSAVSVSSLAAAPSLFQRRIVFNNPGLGKRYFPDFRFDYNPAKAHQISAIYHYNFFTSTPDFLNGFDASFPVAPFNTNQGSQISNRNQMTGIWRWNMAANKSNEVRFGIQSAPVSFFPDLNVSLYPQFTTSLGPIRVRPILNLVSQPLLGFATQGRNTSLGQLIDNFGWTRGKHSLSFGGSATRIRGIFAFHDAAVGSVGLGVVAEDPASGIFSVGNMPGSSASDRGNAGDLYGMLAGRITGYGANVYVDNSVRQFVTGASDIEKANQTEFGFYGSDNWRIRPALTLNFGLRWEYQGAPYDPANLYHRMQNGYDDVFGVSGVNNFFSPGVPAGATIATFELNGDRPWYGRDLNNWAPSVGLAWQPNWDTPWWNRIFGGPGKTVFRGGYSITFTREGINNFLGVASNNPGYFGALFADPVDPGTATVPGTFDAGSVTVAAANIPNVLQDPATFGSPFPLDPVSGFGVFAFQPDLGIPTVQSWSVGIQREINPNLVLEIRYVGNHGTGLWRRENLNEINIFENGFLNEFTAALNNVTICRANSAACLAAQAAAGVTVANRTVNNFANWGLTGQSALPILTGAFTGSTNTAAGAATQRNANFRSGFRVSNLDTGQAGSFANVLASSFSFWNNIQAAGFASNFWRINPHARGGAFQMTNDMHTTYNALHIEARQRPTRGLQFSANYSFSRSLSNNYADSSVSAINMDTLRDKRRNKNNSPWDLRHQFKMHGIWEMPFGPGKRWSSGQAWLNRIIEGWEVSNITRWQSGRVVRVVGGLGGTFNAADGGVELIGITPDQIQNQLSIRKTPTGQVFYFPASLLDSAQARANSSFIRPCRSAGQFCQRLFLWGPQFFRADINVVKRTKITERVNFEFRAEFLNAFNNINFYYGGSPAATVPSVSTQSTSFGRVFDAYQDLSTTDDPGGRIIQFVFRINF